MKYYLVGIKGTGMSSLAKMLYDKGYEVVGSDTNEYYFTEDDLIKRGIKIKLFNEENIIGDAFYIIGCAYDEENIEVSKIFKNNYMYLYYNDFIGSLISLKTIACSGTHGKTTTSYLISKMLDEKCNYIIGDGSGKGYDNEWLVLEACEYRNHFLSYSPYIGIITNIEMDHPDFFKTKKDLLKSFQMFATRCKKIVINGDDRNTKYISHNNKITYGFKKKNDAIIKILSTTKKGYYICLKYLNKNYYLKVPFLGRHMIYNFVAAFLITVILDKEYKQNIKLDMPSRRLTTYNFKKAILIDDYAHHPTEINALYNSIKLMYHTFKINVVFQPHTYERTFKFKKEFKRVLNRFDEVYVMDVFTSKREKNDLNKQKTINKIFKNYKSIDKFELAKVGQKEEIWLFLGAGNSRKYIKKIINENV